MSQRHENQALLVAIGCHGSGAVILGAHGEQVNLLIIDSGDDLHDLPDWNEDDHPTTPGLFVWEGTLIENALGPKQQDIYREWDGRWRVATTEDLTKTLGTIVMSGKIPV
jgi:hypothetical protein